MPMMMINRCLSMLLQQNFDKFYEQIYGERWPAIREAMIAPGRQVQRKNPFAEEQPFSIDAWEPVGHDMQAEAHLIEEEKSQKKNLVLSIPPLCQWNGESGEIPRGKDQLLSYYILDPASVLVATNLRVQPGEKVLDLCAAPGGKSLVLAQSLFRSPHEKSEIVLNEMSADRRERLKKVIQQYISKEARPQLWIRGKDGVRFGLEVKNYFDAILVDAPCSGERHLIQNAKELKSWKEQRTKFLAQKQYALLCSAWLSLKVGGRLMYSTCSLSPQENDEVIEKFLHKKKEASLGQQHYKLEHGESTQYGQIYLPDRCDFGPMYSSLLIKTS